MKKLLCIFFLSVLLLVITGCGKTSYCCQEGYTLSNGKCLKQEKHKVKITYTCPNGYIAKTNGVCYRSNGTRAMYASQSYSCNYGSLVGNECIETHVSEPFVCENDKK